MTDTGHNSLPSLCTACGYIPPKKATALDRKIERSNLKIIIGISLAVLVGFSQLTVWGDSAFEIRWVQFRDLVGFSSVQSLERMAEICSELKKRDCVEHAYLRQSQLDKRNIWRLAEFQISRHKFKEAVNTLKNHVAKEKSDTRAMMMYANALTELKRFDEAVKYYEYLISKSQSLPAEAAKYYVKCLARAKRYQQAQNVILKIRKTYPGTPRFMDGEYRVLAGLKSGPVPASSKIQ